jgi:uncharacterized protein YndB with AHSA1/START domain
MTREGEVERERPRREIERVIEIDAPAEAVWKALTDARELERWFPLDAEITPGEDGEVRLRWGAYFDERCRIDAWQPGRHLRYAFPSFGSARLATDYLLEGSGGRTVLRVVSSGFGHGEDWDELFDGVSRGWDFELFGLRHYLEHHRGRDRAVAWAVHPYRCTHEEAWARLTGANGWLPAAPLAALRPGAAFNARTATGETLSGTLVLWQPPRQLTVTVNEFDNALLRIGLEAGHGGGFDVWLFMSTWGVDPVYVHATARRWSAFLAETFADSRPITSQL